MVYGAGGRTRDHVTSRGPSADGAPMLHFPHAPARARHLTRPEAESFRSRGSLPGAPRQPSERAPRALRPVGAALLEHGANRSRQDTLRIVGVIDGMMHMPSPGNRIC